MSQGFGDGAGPRLREGDGRALLTAVVLVIALVAAGAVLHWPAALLAPAMPLLASVVLVAPTFRRRTPAAAPAVAPPAPPRRWYEVAWEAWLVAFGVALALASRARAQGWQRWVVMAAVPIAALLVVEGLRGLLPGAGRRPANEGGAVGSKPARPAIYAEIYASIARWFSPARPSAAGELAERLPRLSVALAVGCLPLAHLLQRVLVASAGRPPAHVMLAFPRLVPYLGLHVLAFGAGALGGAAIVAIGFQLLVRAPSSSVKLGFIIAVVLGLVPVCEGAAAGPSVVSTANLCWGRVAPARFPVEISEESLRYGPHAFSAPRPGAKGWTRAGFLAVRDHAASAQEARGWLGGLYLVLPDGYRAICAGWPAPPFTLPARATER